MNRACSATRTPTQSSRTARTMCNSSKAARSPGVFRAAPRPRSWILRGKQPYAPTPGSGRTTLHGCATSSLVAAGKGSVGVRCTSLRQRVRMPFNQKCSPPGERSGTRRGCWVIQRQVPHRSDQARLTTRKPSNVVCLSTLRPVELFWNRQPTHGSRQSHPIRG